jgi:hypothetical protein
MAREKHTTRRDADRALITMLLAPVGCNDSLGCALLSGKVCPSVRRTRLVPPARGAAPDPGRDLDRSARRSGARGPRLSCIASLPRPGARRTSATTTSSCSSCRRSLTLAFCCKRHHRRLTELKSADVADGRLPQCCSAVVSSNASLDGGRMQRRGRMPRRSDSATRRWALTMMLPLRWFLAGATLPPRVPAVPCSIQRGAVVRRQSLPRRTDQHSSSSVIASRLTRKLSCKRV